MPSLRSLLLVLPTFVFLWSCATSTQHSTSVNAGLDHRLLSVTISPGGRYAAVADGEIIWVLDLGSNKRIRRFPPFQRSDQPPESVDNRRSLSSNTLVFIGEDLIASTYADESIRIWSIRENRLMASYVSEEVAGPITALAWSPGNNMLAVGGLFGSVYLLSWREESFGNRVDFENHGGAVYDLAFSRDGRYLAVGGDFGSVHIWNVQHPELKLGSLPANPPVTDLEVFTDDRRLLVAGEELTVWDFFKSEELAAIDDPSLGGQKLVIGSAITALVAVAILSGGGTGLGDLTSGLSYPGEIDYCGRNVALSPDGKMLVDRHSGLMSEKIRVLEVDTSNVIRTINPKGAHTCAVAFLPDGQRLLMANDRVARLYNLQTWDYVDIQVYP